MRSELSALPSPIPLGANISRACTISRRNMVFPDWAVAPGLQREESPHYHQLYHGPLSF